MAAAAAQGEAAAQQEEEALAAHRAEEVAKAPATAAEAALLAATAAEDEQAKADIETEEAAASAAGAFAAAEQLTTATIPSQDSPRWNEEVASPEDGPVKRIGRPRQLSAAAIKSRARLSPRPAPWSGERLALCWRLHAAACFAGCGDARTLTIKS